MHDRRGRSSLPPHRLGEPASSGAEISYETLPTVTGTRRHHRRSPQRIIQPASGVKSPASRSGTRSMLCETLQRADRRRPRRRRDQAAKRPQGRRPFRRVRSIDVGVLGYCGIDDIAMHVFPGVDDDSDARPAWLAMARKIGRNMTAEPPASAMSYRSLPGR